MTIQLSMFEVSGDFQHPEKQLALIKRFLNKGKPRDGSGSIQIYNKGHRSYYPTFISPTDVAFTK